MSHALRMARSCSFVEDESFRSAIANEKFFRSSSLTFSIGARRKKSLAVEFVGRSAWLACMFDMQMNLPLVLDRIRISTFFPAEFFCEFASAHCSVQSSSDRSGTMNGFWENVKSTSEDG